MADNIKIVGNILDTITVSRYSDDDLRLIPTSRINENFGGENDYIEFYAYDASGNLIDINSNYLKYKLPSDTGLIPPSSPSNTTGNIQTTDVGITSTLSPNTSSLYPIIEIDPIKDLQDLGYSSGEFRTQYNFFTNILSNNADEALFIKEISQDRTEVRLASITLSNDEVEQVTLSLIDEINTSPYYIDYLLNFGNNEQYVAVNVALNKAPEGNEILFKLYEPLPLNVEEKQTLWVVKEKVNPYIFEINLDKLITPPPSPTLRSPNFDIPISSNQGTVSSTYTNYSTLVSGLQSLQSSSYQRILNLLTSQSIQINVNYRVSESVDFGNFVFFGSAYKRVENFYNKAKEIEFYNNKIIEYTPKVATTASLQNEINLYSASINNIVSQFDGFESYLYFESSSYAWPKTNLTKPFTLLSTGSATTLTWYNNLTSSAKEYDLNNYNNLEYAIPIYVKDDGNNQPFLTFLNMVGHYFDNIWIYLKSIPDVNVANNNLDYGVSRDLVYDKLKSLGLKLYNSQAGDALNLFLIGANTGSSVWDNNFTVTGSYLNNIPRKDLVAELYKRIYHNLPYLLKTKGTVTGLDALITTFGLYTGIDGIQISGVNGTQVWSTLNYQGTTYNNGDPILEAQSAAEWVAANNAQSGAWCYYSGSYEYAKYGKLYNWYAVNDRRGFAPEGWHVPTQTEWRILTSSLGSTNAERSNKLRASGSNYWLVNSSATNGSGLAIVGNGTRNADGTWTGNNVGIQSGSGLWASGSTSGRFVIFSTNPNSITVSPISAGIGQAVRFVKNTTNTYDDTDNLLNIREFGGSLKSDLLKGYNPSKVRIVANSIVPALSGSVLSPIVSLQTYPTASSQFRDSDMNYIDISFSPQTQIDNYISRSIAFDNPSWNLDDYIGDPSYIYSSSYGLLDAERIKYYQTGVTGFRPFTSSLLDYNKYIRLVEYFDNALFKMLGDFVPERTSLSTGVTINSPALERNKVAYANPTTTTTQSVYEADYSIASISSSYGTFYNALTSSNNTMGWYDGELSGSVVDVNDYYDFINPYTKANRFTPVGIYRITNISNTDLTDILVSGSLLNRSKTGNSLLPMASRPIGTILAGTFIDRAYADVPSPFVSNYSSNQVTITRIGLDSQIVTPILSNDNEFLHSDYNVLLNNISQSIKSSNRNVIEYIGGDLRPTSSITYPAELQDSYLSLQSYNNSRYNGTKLTSLNINTYTSASYTGSDGITVVNGDNSYGKTAVIDRYTRRIGLFTQIETSSFLPKRNNVALKYLVDEFGGLTELNQLNNNWEDIQRTFVINNTGSVALFNNKQYSNQVTTDGSKIIFDSGYNYTPILYYGTGSIDNRLYFDNILPQLESYTEARISRPVTGNRPNSRIVGNSDPRTVIEIRPTPNGGQLAITSPGPTGPDSPPYFATSSTGVKWVSNLFQNVVEGSEYFTPGTSNGIDGVSYTVPIGGKYNINVDLKLATYSQVTVGAVEFGSRLYIKKAGTTTETLQSSKNTRIIYTIPFFLGLLDQRNIGLHLGFRTPSTPNNSPITIQGRPVAVPPGTQIGGVAAANATVYAYDFPRFNPTYNFFWYQPPSNTYAFSNDISVNNTINGTAYSYYPSLTFTWVTNNQFIRESPTGNSVQYTFFSFSNPGPTPQTLYISSNAEGTSNFGEKILDLSLNDSTTQNVELDIGDKIIYKLLLAEYSNTTAGEIIAYIPPVSSTNPQRFTVSSPEISTGNYPFVSNATPFISAISSASLLMNTGLSNFYGGNYTHLPTFQTGSQTYISSLYSENGDVDYPLVLFPGSVLLVTEENGRIFESIIKNVTTRDDGKVQIDISLGMSSTLQQQINNKKVLEVVFLNKIKDETNVILKFIKKPGQTSYGLLIPDTLAPDVLNNIDTITRQVKQKILSDQQGTTQ